MHAGRHPHNEELALVGVVLVACGIAIIAGGVEIHPRIVSALAAWLAAAGCFVAAHRPPR